MKILKKSCFLLPIIWGLYIVIRYSVNVPYWDEWSTIIGISKIQSIKDFAAYCWQFHNEHRIVFPNLFYYLNYQIFGYNSQMLMYFNIIILTGIFSIICIKVSRDQLIQDEVTKWATIIIIGFMVFNTIQYENILWGFQIGFLFVVFSAVLSLFFFSSGFSTGKFSDFILAAVFAVVSSFSSLPGLLIWPVCIFILLFVYFTKEYKNGKAIALYIVGGGASYCLYFINFSTSTMATSYNIKVILKILRYYLVTLGNVFSFGNVNIALGVGIIIVMYSAFLVIRMVVKKDIVKNVFALSMLLFGLCVDGVIALGRTELNAVLTSRYTSYTLLIYVSTILMSVYYYNIHQVEIKPIFQKIALLSVFLLVCGTNIFNLKYCKETQISRTYSKNYLRNYQHSSLKELNQIYPWKTYNEAYNNIEFLRREGYIDFDSSKIILDDVLLGKTLIAPPIFIGFNKDTIVIDDKTLSTDGGWAVDCAHNNTASAVYISINDKIYSATFPIERPDVKNHFNNESYLQSGFNFSISKDRLKEGINTLKVIVVCNDGQEYFETQQYVIERKGSNFVISG